MLPRVDRRQMQTPGNPCAPSKRNYFLDHEFQYECYAHATSAEVRSEYLMTPKSSWLYSAP